MINQESIQLYENSKDYSFSTDSITFGTIEVKGKKQSYVTGYISVPEIDLYDDLVTKGALQSLLKQIEESTITIDYEHEAWRDDNSILPVAKIVEAKVDDRGLWVKCILNQNSPKYENLWGSIKDGFVNAFSIAFKPLKTIDREMEGKTVRVIEELVLLNVAFTGAPVNKGAVIQDFSMKSVMLKAISDMKEEQVVISKSLLTKLTEVKNMEEEKQKIVEEGNESEEKEIEEKSDESQETSEGKEESIEESDKEAELKSMIDKLTALVEKQSKDNELLKTDIKSLRAVDVFKSPAPVKPETKSIEVVNMLNLIQ